MKREGLTEFYPDAETGFTYTGADTTLRYQDAYGCAITVVAPAGHELRLWATSEGFYFQVALKGQQNEI